MIIYLLTFYLFDDIEKKIGITHANHSTTSKTLFIKMHVQPERLIFYLRSALGIIHDARCDRRTPKTIILLK